MENNLFYGFYKIAVSIGFLITKHITRELIALYLLAEIVGALLASLFVGIVIGKEANLGANAPNHSYSLPLIFGIEVLASALLMAVILTVVYKRFERIWRCRYRSYCWIGYFVFGFYIWSVNESCSFISSSIVIGSMGWSMVVLDCNVCWYLCNCINIYRKKFEWITNIDLLVVISVTWCQLIWPVASHRQYLT